MTITCPECHSRFKADEEMVGKKAKCGACEHVFVVPGQAERKESSHTGDSPERAWTSLYLAGMSALLLLFRGTIGGLIPSLLLGLGVETAAVLLAGRGWRDARAALRLRPASHLARTGFYVNSVLLALVGLSMVLTVYQFFAGPGPGLGDVGKILNQLTGNGGDLLKNLPK